LGLEGERSFLNVCLMGESGRDIIKNQLCRERTGEELELGDSKKPLVTLNKLGYYTSIGL